ncbi:copper resistance protein CopC [Bacillus sp. EB106-08-02-XG196]|uniref:copper resistance CopC family protein n=1 Tax=Bacillus sp. EB106-08-02-XG196 TaxID=2737049 RepID=UPI0015C411E2|nr:copper resistance protein CopC [Bacillus sp. EB106-08-02-XG196]NWQ42597.1 copper resistance protein CopC [Bacillus sp. EB106-08-02-XG196]
MKKIILFLFCTLLIVPSLVSAHTSLSSSNPSEGQVVTENLEQIILTFGTSIEELSTMDLVKDGNKIPLEEIKVENMQLTGTLAKPLENGSYIIQWTIVGEDGHPIKGEINFVVQMDQNEVEENPVTPEESEANLEDDSQIDQIGQNSEDQNTASDTVEKTDEQNDDSSSMLITVFIILIVIFVIVLLFFTRKKKRKS